ncbi:sensor histidine kinase [Oleisolibacter albus]|uniref:sensor histidine kinase n=1 Tax=Oleisolibacter albus TaxID=2171757 RepID=UPI000DF2ED12|nr:sensor histidine kinase [Oleisolibacter albus]
MALRSLRVRLLVLAAAASLPLFVLASVVLVRFADIQFDWAMERQRNLARATAAAMEREIGSLVGSLEILALAPELSFGDMRGFHDRLARVTRPYPTRSFVLYDSDGQQVVNSSLPYGSPLGQRTSRENLDFVFATGRPRVTDLFIGKPLGRLLVAVDVPVMQGGRVAYVLSGGLTPAGLTGILAEQHLPSGWVVVVADRVGRIIARIPNSDLFAGKAVSPLILSHLAQADEAVFPNVTQDKTAVYTAALRAPSSGWIVAVGVPREELDGARNRALWTFFVGGGALGTLNLALVLFIARSVSRPIRRLALHAKALGQGEALPFAPSGLGDVDIAAAALSQASDAQRQTAEHQALLMREVDHRAKNALTVVQTIVRLTRAERPADFVDAVDGRIAALARAHTLLAKSRWRGADLSTLIGEELMPYGDAEVRITLAGPAVTLQADAVQSIGLLFHELATNAAKYGALSSPAGRIIVAWRIAPAGDLEVTWREHGGPPLGGPPVKQGFGSTILAAAATQVGGSAVQEWEPTGLRCTFRIKADFFAAA